MYDFHSEKESIVLDQDNRDRMDDTSEFDEGVQDSEQQDSEQSPDTISRKKAAAIWILKVQEKYKLTQSTMALILKDMTGFIQDLLSDLQDEINASFSSVGIDQSSIPGLSELFSPTSMYGSPFDGLQSQYQQQKYYKEELGLIVSYTPSTYLQ